MTAAYDPVRRKQLVDQRKADGLCQRCGLVQPELDLSQCRACLDKVNGRRLRSPRTAPERLAHVSPTGGFNACCQAAGFHRVDCAERPR